MTTDPSEIVAGVAARAGRPVAEDAPTLLHHSPEPPPALAPVRSTEVVEAIHRSWARVHAQPESPVGQAPAPPGGRSPAAVRARVLARVATAASEVSRSAQRDDRALIGDLIRAVDALAFRVDELGGRLHDLEEVVHDVITVTSEDLSRVRAALSVGPPADAARKTTATAAPTG